ncbi:MAG TPA: carboxymuconolactone decarboxylase family protein [Xanthobacteraceae bacterium]|nr:carboxymuconolactone decarboxylase family protein [Xanthobacteraceae bacterium]
MQPRLDYMGLAPNGLKAVLALESYVRGSLDPRLLDLVKIRASQINGCAYCIHMHSKEARAKGETEERIYLLDAWRESPLYTPRERAALAWTEAVTLVADTHVPDDVFDELRRHFSDADVANLTLAVATINVWNRLAISFRAVHPVEAKAA